VRASGDTTSPGAQRVLNVTMTAQHAPGRARPFQQSRPGGVRRADRAPRRALAIAATLLTPAVLACAGTGAASAGGSAGAGSLTGGIAFVGATIIDGSRLTPARSGIESPSSVDGTVWVVGATIRAGE
jgi:hypothetical protein